MTDQRTITGRAVEDALTRQPGRRTAIPPEDLAYIDPPTRATLRRLALTAGVNGRAAVVYLAQRFRYHLGKSLPPTPPSGIHGPELDWLNRRAWDVLDEHRNSLPPLADRTQPR